MINIAFALLANRDYYLFATQGKTMWEPLAFFEKRLILIPVFTVMFLGYLSFTFSSAFMSAAVPGCADADTVALLKKIISDEVKKSGNTLLDNAITLSGFRTQDTNPKTGALTCSAHLEIKQGAHQESGPLSYTVELTDTGGEFYVTLLER